MNKIALFGDSTCDLTPEVRKSRDIDYARMLVNWKDKDKKDHEIYASLDWEVLSPKEMAQSSLHPKSQNKNLMKNSSPI